jgi:5-methylcytosine-specific restriction endonuclease McrA
MRDPRSTPQYRQARARFIAGSDGLCAWPLCPVPGRVVNRSLNGRSRWGPQVDHTVPYAVDPAGFWNVSNWRLMHNNCNVTKGLRTDLAPALAPVRVSEEERAGLTSEELAAWKARGMDPCASRQWFGPDAYLGLVPARPAPSWWPPQEDGGSP